MTNFDKMHGNGNDFVVVNSIEKNLVLKKSLIKKLSDRNCGIGFDQLITINAPKKDGYDFLVAFYNSDGGKASMCLNGIRAAASYIWKHNFAPKTGCHALLVTGFNFAVPMFAGRVRVTPRPYGHQVPCKPSDAAEHDSCQQRR